MINKEDIFLDLEVKDKEELYKKMNAEFLKRGYVNEEYLGNLIEREKNYPTGLEFEGYNIAIPHTDTKYIKKQRFVFIRLKNPIKYHEMVTSAEIYVKVLVMLLVTDGSKQADYLVKMMEVLGNKDNYEILSTTDDINKIKEIFI